MVYATRIGDIDLLAVLDMVPPSYDPLEFFPGVSKEAWGAEAAHLVDGRLQLYYGCYALRGNGKTIMVDTGKGPGPHPDRGNRRGDLPGQLRLHGIDPNDVDLVVHTHLHHDHVGWNVTLGGSGEARPTFPKARHLVPRGDWEYFTRPDVLEQSPHVRDHVVALERLGIVDLIEGEHQLTAGGQHDAHQRAHSGASQCGRLFRWHEGGYRGRHAAQHGPGRRTRLVLSGGRRRHAGGGHATGDAGAFRAGEFHGGGGAFSTRTPIRVAGTS